MRQDAPDALRARVLARLSSPSGAGRRRLRSSIFGEPAVAPAEAGAPSAGSIWTPRLAWTAAAVAVVAAVVLVAPRWWARPDVPASRTTAADLEPVMPAPSVPSGSAVAPTAVVAQAAPAGAEKGRPVRAARAAGADTSVARGAEWPPFIDPLPAPDPIAIGALETERIAEEGVTIEPLTLDALRIEPIHVQR